MPNWCYNYMTVIGNKRDLRKFMKDIEADDPPPTPTYREYDLNKLVPLDPKASVIRTSTRTDENGKEVTHTYTVFASSGTDGFDGYRNALELWGSKWGACRVEIDDPEVREKDLFIRYESAWSPADELIRNISSLYPSLIFGTCSDEESRAFVCWSVFHNGETIESGGRDPNQLTPELRELSDKAEADDADDNALEEWWEAHSEWNNYLVDQCAEDMLTVMREYRKHLAYVLRCNKEGRTPRTFISSV